MVGCCLYHGAKVKSIVYRIKSNVKINSRLFEGQGQGQVAVHDGDDRRGVHRVLDSLSGELALTVDTRTFVVFAHYTLLW